MYKFKILSGIIYCCFFIASVQAQVDKSVWDNLKTIKTENYEFQIPKKWQQIPMSKGQGPEQMIVASGLPILFNNSPVMANLFLVKQNTTGLEELKENVIKGYKENSDREFPKKFKEGEEKIKLASGEDAYIINTRFYRKSKGLHQSRYDLVVYSQSKKEGYIYTVSVQYNDETYKFEADNKLNEFSKKIYSYFKLL